MVGIIVHSILAATPGVRNLVCSEVGGVLKVRIFPLRAPQNTVSPYIIYRVVGIDPTLVKDRVSPMDTWELAVVCVGDRYEDVCGIGTAVRDALDYYAGTYVLIGFGNLAQIAFVKAEDLYSDGDLTYNRLMTFKIKIRR